MFNIDDNFVARLLGRFHRCGEIPIQPLKTTIQTLPCFHLFSALPLELRRQIWFEALPSRIIEAPLDFDTNGVCGYYTSKTEVEPPNRHLPTLFFVSRESRTFCQEQYVPFANTLVHPVLDILYIAWDQRDLVSRNVKFLPILDSPLSKILTVGITIARNPNGPRSRFGALLSCLRSLGSPRKLLLCLNGPDFVPLHPDMDGFSTASSNIVRLIDWPIAPRPKANTKEFQEILGQVLDENDGNNEGSPLIMPAISQRLYYVYSGP